MYVLSYRPVVAVSKQQYSVHQYSQYITKSATMYTKLNEERQLAVYILPVSESMRRHVILECYKTRYHISTKCTYVSYLPDVNVIRTWCFV
jgi:hypothetical protein